MLNYSCAIVREITDFLTWQHIPYNLHLPEGMITFSASTTNNEALYEYRLNISDKEILVEATSPLKVPLSEKIQIRLLKFFNDINRKERSGGYFVLNRDTGALLCQMTIPFSYDRCGRMDDLLPIPANTLNRYWDAIQKLIQGKTSVETEVKSWKNAYQYRDISPLVSCSSDQPNKRWR